MSGSRTPVPVRQGGRSRGPVCHAWAHVRRPPRPGPPRAHRRRPGRTVRRAARPARRRRPRGAGPREPDRRARRLQRRAVPAVRAPPQHVCRGRCPGRRHRDGAQPADGRAVGGTARGARSRRRLRLGQLRRRCPLGAARGRGRRAGHRPGPRQPGAGGRGPVELGRAGVLGGPGRIAGRPGRPRRRGPGARGRCLHPRGERGGGRVDRRHGPERRRARDGRARVAPRLRRRCAPAGAVGPRGGRSAAADRGHAGAPRTERRGLRLAA